MTEHFTREAVIAAGGIVHRDGNVFFTNLDKLNAMFTAKAKEWEAQGAVAWLDLEKLAIGGMAYATNFQASSKQIQLYTHALPAQPADPVNAELVKALEKLIEQHDELAEEDNSGRSLARELAKADHAREVLSRAKAAPETGEEFVRTIKFAIAQGSDAGEFLNAWLHGDTDEWPEFASAQPQQKEGV